MKPYKGRIPFRDGRMLGWSPVDDFEYVADPRLTWYPNRWEDNHEFNAQLEYTGWSKGTSSVRLHFDDKTNPGRSYSMTLSAFDTVARTMENGLVYGRWTFRKVGANYGLYPVTS